LPNGILFHPAAPAVYTDVSEDRPHYGNIS